MKQIKKIEDSQLWRNASDVAEDVYDQLHSFPDEERWSMQSRLRQRAFDATDNIASALGSIDPRDVKWLLGMARRDLFGIKNGLSIAIKTGYLDPIPKLLAEIDNIVDQLDVMLEAATKDIPAWFSEMQPPKAGPKE